MRFSAGCSENPANDDLSSWTKITWDGASCRSASASRLRFEAESLMGAAMEDRTHKVVVSATDHGERLDRLLATRIKELSRSRIKALILAGEVTMTGQTIGDPGQRVNASAEITIHVPPAEPAHPQPEPIPLHVVYEDSDLIVIDKPAGLVVHPAAGNWTGTLVNALIAHCGESLSGVGGVRRPGIVHRLDKDTSGLLVIAKTDAAHRALAAQFADHGRTGPLEREYLAFVWGAPARPKGIIDAPIDRNPHSRQKMAVREGGRTAVTHWEILKRFGDSKAPVASLLSLQLKTGRTHQIRVHLAHIGHPLLGDRSYAGGFKTKAGLLDAGAQEALAALDRQALHAHFLAFEHPRTREILEFRSELPAELTRLHQRMSQITAAPRR
jgi:23S rRNA pseudouridine1911/1915/1917 synthase